MANSTWWQRERPAETLSVEDYLNSNPPQLAQATRLAFEQLAHAVSVLAALPIAERHQRASEFEQVRDDFIEINNRVNPAFFSSNEDIALEELDATLSAYRSGTSLLAKAAGLAGQDSMSSALQAGLFENATPMKLVERADIDEARMSMAKIEHVIGDHVFDPLFDAPSITQNADGLSDASHGSLNKVEYEGSLEPDRNRDLSL
ncbi:MAG: hypothetical protein MRY32_00630 [Rickettsiales bacterium]|nr:hypothetical protein [Rickettsiales bacterium]